MRTNTELHLDKRVYALPLRRELADVLHVLNAQRGRVRTGLDFGFTHAGVSQHLRQLGGYWVTVEPTPARRALVAAALGEEAVFSAGAGGELPFEDKQFDVVVLAHGALPGESEEASAMIRECHRVIKAGGSIILTVEYRKRYGVASALNSSRVVSGAGGSYNEAEIFRLMKDGFDVLGFRTSCRFWVQLVRQWADRRRTDGSRAPSNRWLRVLYAFAYVLDAGLLLTRGYQMTVHARRKGWRGQRSNVLGDGTPVSDALLSDPRREGHRVSLSRFR